MQKDSRILDDLARLGTSGLSAVMDIRRELEAMVGAKVEKLLLRMHLVTREEHEVVREMAIKAREENEKLQKRVAELENSLKNLARK